MSNISVWVTWPTVSKTPLARSKVIWAIHDPEQAEWMRQISVMDDLVAYHLKRAVSGPAPGNSPEPLA